jgi:hypothetical protein
MKASDEAPFGLDARYVELEGRLHVHFFGGLRCSTTAKFSAELRCRRHPAVEGGPHQLRIFIVAPITCVRSLGGAGFPARILAVVPACSSVTLHAHPVPELPVVCRQRIPDVSLQSLGLRTCRSLCAGVFSAQNAQIDVRHIHGCDDATLLSIRCDRLQATPRGRGRDLSRSRHDNHDFTNAHPPLMLRAPLWPRQHRRLPWLGIRPIVTACAF